MKLDDPLKFGEEVESLPNFDLHTFESVIGITDTIAAEDQGKTLVYYDPATITIPDGLENEDITKPINGVNASPNDVDVLTFVAAPGASVIVPTGFLPKVKQGGKFQLNLWFDTMFLTGDLIPEAQSVAKKPDKLVPTGTGTYTAVLEDKDKHLVFREQTNFTIPSGVFSAEDEIEFESRFSDVTVVEGDGMTVNKVSSLTRVVPQHGVGELRFESASEAVLYGSLKPL